MKRFTLRWQQGETAKMSNTQLHPEFFDLVGNVRAMRRLKTDSVPLELIRKVLNAGVQAPSGQNQQPWSFVLITQPERKEWFRQHYCAAIEQRMRISRKEMEQGNKRINRDMRAVLYQMDHMHEFPYLLLVCGKRDWPFKVPQEKRVGLAPPNFGAVYPCVQNILLACRAVGLGAALTTMHQVFEKELHAYFSIPDTHGVVVTMPIGWPLGNFGAVRRKPAETCTFFDQWGNQSPPQEQ